MVLQNHFIPPWQYGEEGMEAAIADLIAVATGLQPHLSYMSDIILRASQRSEVHGVKAIANCRHFLQGDRRHNTILAPKVRICMIIVAIDPSIAFLHGMIPYLPS